MRRNSYQSAGHHLKALCEKLSVKFTIHMARHSLATWLRRKKVDVKGAQNAGD